MHRKTEASTSGQAFCVPWAQPGAWLCRGLGFLPHTKSAYILAQSLQNLASILRAYLAGREAASAETWGSPIATQSFDHYGKVETRSARGRPACNGAASVRLGHSQQLTIATRLDPSLNAGSGFASFAALQHDGVAVQLFGQSDAPCKALRSGSVGSASK